MIIVIMAWRNIWRNRIRSLVIMLSVATGMFCGMMVLAIYQGMMAGRVKTVIEAETGNIQVHDPRFKNDYEPAFAIQEMERLRDSLQKLTGLKSYAERSLTTGMLSTATGSAGILIYGIRPEEETSVSGLNRKLITGTGLDNARKNSILVGKKLADKVKLKTGNRLVLTFTDTSSSLVSGSFRVNGIFQTDNAKLDEQRVYVLKTDLDTLLGNHSPVHEVSILFQKEEQTDPALLQLKKDFPGLSIESWKELSPETELMVNTLDIYSYIIIAIIMFALSFGIVNTMLMAILERTREIGMMEALGLNKKRLFLLIVLETVFLTVAGTPAGLLVSWLVTNYFNLHGIDWSGMGREMMSSFGFSTTIYPQFPLDKVLPVMAIVTATSLISCLLPVARALRLKPVDALRK